MAEELKTYQLFPNEFSCTSENGRQYRLRYLPLDSDAPYDEEQIRVAIERFVPDAHTWLPLPLKLNFWSHLLLFTAADAQWPPETVVEMGHDGTNLWFEYEDDLDEIPWGRRHSRWRATFVNVKRRWVIRHLHYLERK